MEDEDAEAGRRADAPLDFEGLTTLLAALRAGANGARDELYERTFERLRRYASRLLSGHTGSTLQPTALIGEAWLRLTKDGTKQEVWADQRHYFGTLAKTMRCVVIDHERARRSQRREANGERVDLESIDAVDGVHGRYQEHAEDLLALDEALALLGRERAELEEVVELRFFLGCSIGESARILSVSESTVTRRFEDARRWLYRRLHGLA